MIEIIGFCFVIPIMYLNKSNTKEHWNDDDDDDEEEEEVGGGGDWC
jgi:hypothetical protein